MQYCVPAIDGAKCALILYCFLFSLSIEEIDDSRGLLDSGKINTDENLIIAMETSMDDDEEESESSSKKSSKRKEYDADKQKEKKVHCVF